MSKAQQQIEVLAEVLDGATTAEDVLVEALAAGMSYADAGRMVGKSDRTVRRRMEDGPFRRRVAARRCRDPRGRSRSYRKYPSRRT